VSARTDLRVETTPVPGLLVMHLPVHEDNRGWFKENWQRAKMTALGLPDFDPVQHNVSFNTSRGATRGFHAEPWDKFVSVASGRVFGAWVDLREGPSFGRSCWIELDPSVAVFVPRGVGNAFQTLEDATAYSYLVNDHWSANASDEYTFVNLADPTVAVPWPIDLSASDVEMSDKDKHHPMLDEVAPMAPRRILVLGADGQVGRALRQVADASGRRDCEFFSRSDCDLEDPQCFDGIRWGAYRAVVNAAAFTAVDESETAAGRRRAWSVNATAVARLVRATRGTGVTLVGFSSDYVFDGEQAPHREDEGPAPLGVYGQTKAAGDLALESVHRHFIIRTSWVVGDGANFVRTMQDLCERGVSPSVVSDQVGRPAFAVDIASAVFHLLDGAASYGTYNVTNSGDCVSWADVAREVFAVSGGSVDDVTAVTTEEYFAGRDGIAPRPLRSTLDLSKIVAAGFSPPPWRDRLREYLGV
jgi:dTDP-4-dehydrorhamnose 3,5-epimerase